MSRRRLDADLVRRGLANDAATAAALIAADRVVVAGVSADNPARMVDPAESIHVTSPPPRFVSRGGEKLDAALEAFGIDVTGLRCIDVGASTGGFTDCLLQRDAAFVVAIDVGQGQLHSSLRIDDRVASHERLHVDRAHAADLGGAGDLVVADLSFISLRRVLRSLLGLCRGNGDLVVLVKPQFEATRAEVDASSGVITDAVVWRRTVDAVAAAARHAGATIMGEMVSPIRGAQGNTEFFLHARTAP